MTTETRVRECDCPAIGVDWEYVRCVHFGGFILLHLKGIDNPDQRIVVTGDKWDTDEEGLHLQGPLRSGFLPVPLVGERAAEREFARREALLLERER